MVITNKSIKIKLAGDRSSRYYRDNFMQRQQRTSRRHRRLDSKQKIDLVAFLFAPSYGSGATGKNLEVAQSRQRATLEIILRVTSPSQTMRR